MRKKLLAKNTIASLTSQVVTLVCGFILPRYFLNFYGSEANGLVNSITQFLSIISFLELGVGAVVQSSLYKPLAEKDSKQVSKVIVSANKFFRRLAQMLLVYVCVLVLFYPLIANQNFGYIYTATLIIAISISSFAQYYLGIVNTLLLNADQRGYIQYNAQTITVLLNTLICVVMISFSCSIQMVKLTTSIIYLIRPAILRRYVSKKYKIDWNIKYNSEPIRQKWNGVAQHIAAVVLDGTDVIVLTLFSTLSNVSIYSVYYLVVKGVKTLFLSLTNGIESLMGDLWAKQESTKLYSLFGWVEWTIHTGTTLVFSCTAALIVPFIRIYTAGVHDANYVQPLFATLLVLANALHCLRLPYNIMVLAAGHYKQTQNNYIIAAILNVVISVIAVQHAGIIGVAIGTLVAMTYQTFWLSRYISKNLVNWPASHIFKQFLIDLVESFLISFSPKLYVWNVNTYIQWITLSCFTLLIGLFIVLAINTVFYRDKVVLLLSKIKRKGAN